MIHTFSLFYKPNMYYRHLIFKQFCPKKVNGQFIWRFTVCEGFYMQYKIDFNLLYITINPGILLGKKEVTEQDLSTLINIINSKLRLYFTDIKVNNLEISRIDYKIDINTIHKFVYLNILKKLSNTYREKKKINHKTGIRLNSKSLSFNFYLKGAEILAKNNSKLKFKEFEDVLRLEIQTKRRLLKDISKTTGKAITLENFFSTEMYKYIFDSQLRGFLKGGDYYTIEKSKEILLQTRYKPIKIDELIQLQNIIYHNGFLSTKELAKLLETSDNTVLAD